MSVIKIIIPIVVITFSILLERTRALDSLEESVDYYEKLIVNHVENAYTYEYKENAKEYEASDTTPSEYGNFDFIIIGAGSTGSVIANRLSEISKFTVLVLEAGTFRNTFDTIPAYWTLNVLTDYNWGYLSTPQKAASLGTVNQQCIVPRGKGIGGTSLLNELVYSRGNKRDYNRWAALLDDPSWNYDNVLPYFTKSEHFHDTNPNAPVDPEYHGDGGLLETTFHVPPNNMTEIFLAASVELGYTITDYNGKDQLGSTILQLNTKHGRRLDEGTAFIVPALPRPNLKVLDESFVTKIEINDYTKEATGVIFTRYNKTYIARPNKEVILSAGAIGSPQILMLSGIGPKWHLEDMGIPVIRNLPVGNSLRDHMFCGVQFSSNATQPSETLEQQILEFFNGTGPLAIANAIDGVGWFKSSIGRIADYPDLELVLSYAGASEIGKRFLRWTDETYNALFNITIDNPITLTPVLLHTKSKGTIRLRSSIPFDYPLIDFNFLSDPEDIERIYDGIKIVQKLAETEAFKSINATLQVRQWAACSDHEFLSEGYWKCFIRQTAVSAFHPVGTCPTGKSPKFGAVVDRNLKVFGVRKLRVADASVFPFTLTGHPNAACVMVGEKISDVIKFDHKAKHFYS